MTAMRLLFIIVLGTLPPCIALADYSIEIRDNLAVNVPAYMSQSLRDRVDEARRDLAEAPTRTPAQLEARTRLLWEWANAYALTGRAIHPELSSVIGRVVQGQVGPRQVETLAPYIDAWFAELSFQDANPTAMGRLATDNPGPFPADAYVELSQTYTVGDAPIREGGGFLISTRSYAGSMAIQNTDPAGPGYISVSSNNPSVSFEPAALPISGMFSGSLGGNNVPRPFFRVSKGTLKPGDIVSIVAGDQSQGSPGIKLPSQANSAHRVRVFVSFDAPIVPQGGSALVFSMNELPFQSVGLETTALRGFGPSIAKVGKPVLLSVRSEDQFRNRATGGFEIIDVYHGKRRIRDIRDRSSAYQEFSHTFTEPGVYYLTARSRNGKLTGTFNPILVEPNPRMQIYWGETHGHTGFAEGSGTVDNFFRFSREDARLDFMTLSEHDLWMDDWEWEVLRRHVISANDPGRFVTFLGYEWTVHARLGGHHNVLFRTPQDRNRVERQRAPHLTEMHSTLMAENNPADVLVIPHAHNPGNWWESEPAIEHLVEIVSNHGTFEWLGRAYLAEGHHLGCIGGSDDHIGHPGIRPLSSSTFGSDNFGGMAAVLANELTNDALFDALRHRETYATNGQKIILRTTVNDGPMGQVLPARKTAKVIGRTIGTGSIRYIDLIQNGELVRRLDFANPASAPTGTLALRFFSETDPYERGVKSRGFRPWVGTVSLAGGRLVGVSTPDTENTFTEGARISEADPQTAEVFLRSRGAYRTLLLDIEDVTETAAISIDLSSRSEQVTKNVSLAGLTGEGHLINTAIGPHNDEILVQWITPSSERDRKFEFNRDARPGDTFYVRVTQDNGGMAWSSPVKMTGAPSVYQP